MRARKLFLLLLLLACLLTLSYACQTRVHKRIIRIEEAPTTTYVSESLLNPRVAPLTTQQSHGNPPKGILKVKSDISSCWKSPPSRPPPSENVEVTREVRSVVRRKDTPPDTPYRLTSHEVPHSGRPISPSRIACRDMTHTCQKVSQQATKQKPRATTLHNIPSETSRVRVKMPSRKVL